jgi:cytoskeletal protein RodZ
MKKISLNNKLPLSIILVVLMALTIGGGIYLSEKKQSKTKQNTDNQTGQEQTNPANEQQVQNNLNTKEQSQNNQTQNPTPTNPEQNNTPTQSGPSDQLADVSLQATLNKEDNNSISVTLYGQAASYTIDKSSDNGTTWKNVLNGSQYSGAGGLFIEKILDDANGSERLYRITRVIGGQTSATKQVLVSRNLVVSGSSNFRPGVR